MPRGRFIFLRITSSNVPTSGRKFAVWSIGVEVTWYSQIYICIFTLKVTAEVYQWKIRFFLAPWMKPVRGKTLRRMNFIDYINIYISKRIYIHIYVYIYVHIYAYVNRINTYIHVTYIHTRNIYSIYIFFYCSMCKSSRFNRITIERKRAYYERNRHLASLWQIARRIL